MALRLIPAAGCILIVTLAGFAGVGSGCSAQGQGDRCTNFPSVDADINGTSECQSGLICYSYASLPNPNAFPYDRCCPQDLTNPANVRSCYQPNMPDAAVPDASTDGPSETTTDSPQKDGPAKDAPPADGPTKDSPTSDAPPADAPPSDAAEAAPTDAPTG